MRGQHFQILHYLWRQFLQPGDVIVDATLGNGKDTEQLAKILFQHPGGVIHACDIQEKAIMRSKTYLKEKIPQHFFHQIFFYHSSHESFSFLPDGTIQLFVYNLGYLPNSDKKITTRKETTLESLQYALTRLGPDRGAISIMCYPGHAEGKEEAAMIEHQLNFLDNRKYQINTYKNFNNPTAPFLIWIEIKKTLL